MKDKQKKPNKKPPLFFRLLYKIIHLFYPKFTVESKKELLPPGNIYVSNHAQLHGPLGNYFYFPHPNYIWVTGEMFSRKEVTPYAMEDFWRYKSKWVKWIYWLFSVLFVAPMSSFLFRNAKTIPVYRDVRLRKTLKLTIQKLNEGYDVIIFPEHREELNRFINQFQIHFVDVARGFYKQTGRELAFYPMYTCRELKKIVIGEPVTYCFGEKIENERLRIISYLQNEITLIGESLPDHEIVPYVNGKKKNRKRSKE